MSAALRYIAVVALVILIPWAAKKLFVLGGTPKEMGATMRYRMKPARSLLLWIFVLVGLTAVWSGISNNHIGFGLIYIVLGVGCIGLLTLAQHEIILDQTGIRDNSLICGETSIAWDDLSHFERLYNPRSDTHTYFIRSKTGTTIAMGESSFDTSDLFRRIEKHRILRELPYKRRKWYGG